MCSERTGDGCATELESVTTGENMGGGKIKRFENIIADLPYRLLG